MKNIIGMVACCALLGTAGNLSAQAEDPMGPFDLSLKLEAATTDNRDSLPNEESNTDFLVSPRIAAIFEMDRSYLDFYYEPTLRYRTDPRENQNDEEFLHDLGIHLEHSVTPRLTLRVTEDYTYTDDPSVETAGGTLRRDSSFSLNRVEGLLAYDINRQSRVEVDARHRLKTYDESELSFLDEESVSAGARAARQVSRTVSLSLEARAEEFSYEYDDLSVGARPGTTLDRGFTAMSAGVGIENEFQANCRASLRVGVKSLDYEDEDIDSESAPYAVAILQLSAVPSTRFTASARHELRDSDVALFSSQEYTSVYAGLEVDASERVTFDVSGTYRMGDYDADKLPSGLRTTGLPAGTGTATPGGVAVRALEGDETAVILKAGVGWEVSDKTRVKLAHMFEDEDSDVSVSFTRNETTLSLVRQF